MDNSKVYTLFMKVQSQYMEKGKVNSRTQPYVIDRCAVVCLQTSQIIVIIVIINTLQNSKITGRCKMIDRYPCKDNTECSVLKDS